MYHMRGSRLFYREGGESDSRGNCVRRWGVGGWIEAFFRLIYKANLISFNFLGVGSVSPTPPPPEIRDCMHHHIWIFLTANHSLLQQLLGKIYFKQIHCLILKPYKHHESQNSSSQLSQWFLISSALHKQVTLIEFVAYWVRIH